MSSATHQKLLSAVAAMIFAAGVFALLLPFVSELSSDYAYALESGADSGSEDETGTTFTRVSRDLVTPVVYIYDDNMFTDEYELIYEGVPGTIIRTYEYIGKNTALLIGGETIIEPVSKIVRTGTRRRLSVGVYAHPAKGIVTSTFGYRAVSIGSGNHKGWDISNAKGTPILAADGGTVLLAGVYEDYGGYGELVVIEHDNGDWTLYAHNSEILVEEGAIVAQGDEIAKMGSSGTASGIHLHFEYRPEGGSAANPDILFDAKDFTKE
ncbi:MAG: peptidoglycan DD-metalloendopeptidase family protein [Oscillospiraceae bacterium]|nr:peptidoglycan DD-metalloendopeptidase family protein [Oscillospiraceae bacterium]